MGRLLLHPRGRQGWEIHSCLHWGMCLSSLTPAPSILCNKGDRIGGNNFCLRNLFVGSSGCSLHPTFTKGTKKLNHLAVWNIKLYSSQHECEIMLVFSSLFFLSIYIYLCVCVCVSTCVHKRMPWYLCGEHGQLAGTGFLHCSHLFKMSD